LTKLLVKSPSVVDSIQHALGRQPLSKYGAVKPFFGVEAIEDHPLVDARTAGDSRPPS
jgi:hypothetical protein